MCSNKYNFHFTTLKHKNMEAHWDIRGNMTPSHFAIDQ